MQAARGRVPEDAENFSFEAVQKLRKACRHVCYLLNEGYSLKAACTFVGNHFLLSERQRLAVMRSVASEAQRMLRAKNACRPVTSAIRQFGLTALMRLLHWKYCCANPRCFAAWTEPSGILHLFGEHTD